MARILYIITKANFGGAQRYVYDLATTALAEGNEVAVITGGAGTLTDKLREAQVRTLPLPGLSQKKSFLGDLLSFGSLFSLIRIIRRERPDIVHVNSAKAGGLGACAANLLGVPRIVFTAHGWEFRGERSRLSKAGIRFFSWLTMLCADETIAVSQAVYDAVAGWPFLKHRLFVIKNGVEDFDCLSREKARAALMKACPAARRIEHDPHAFLIGTLAELTPIKGLLYGLHALDALPEERRTHTYWMICGEGRERAMLERLATALGLEDRVFFVGFVPEARTLLKAFDLFLFPSLFEAFAYAILEAGHAGLPVVASDTGGLPEIITDETRGILVPPRDSFGIARAIEALAENRDKRTALGHALKAHVDKEFSRDEMVRKTFALYASRRRR